MIFILKQIKYFVVETWILFRKNEKLVSNVILEAYHHYETMEFGRDKVKTSVANPNRHIKLINISGKKVRKHGIVQKQMCLLKRKRELLFFCFVFLSGSLDLGKNQNLFYFKVIYMCTLHD